MTELTMMRGKKVIVTGPSGAGKTTFSAGLARAWGVPHIEVDALHHLHDGHTQQGTQRLREAVGQLIAANPGGWIFDGTNDRVMDILCDEADTLVWLQMPFCIAYSRLVRRTFRRMASREMLWGTHRERWRSLLTWNSPLGWGLILWRGHHRKTRGRIRRAKPGLRVVILRNPREVSRFLAEASGPT